MGVRRIVDTHFHIWELKDVEPVGVLAAKALRCDMLWSNYEAATTGLPVRHSVYVQVANTVDDKEAQSISSLAAEQPRLARMVAYAPVESPLIGQYMDWLARFPIIKGIRRITQDEKDPAFCATPDFVRGTRLLGDRGLVLELLVYGAQFRGVIQLAKACPDTTIVVDHLGKPNISSPEDDWYAGMQELSKFPNVLCKLSVGLQTQNDPPLDLAAMRPIVAHVVKSLGYHRVLFASNWPVSTVVIGYHEWVAFLEDALGGSTQKELDDIFYQNARRTYGF